MKSKKELTEELLTYSKKLKKENEQKLIQETDINIKVDELRRSGKYKNFDDYTLRRIAKSMK